MHSMMHYLATEQSHLFLISSMSSVQIDILCSRSIKHLFKPNLFVSFTQARCSIMAAANPIGGRYDPSLTFAENVSYLVLTVICQKCAVAIKCFLKNTVIL